MSPDSEWGPQTAFLRESQQVTMKYQVALDEHHLWLKLFKNQTPENEGWQKHPGSTGRSTCW